MSTRSGRRIHSSFHENTVKVEAEPVPKIERKTRGKRQKGNEVNLDVTVPRAATKRQNYVAYPAESNSTDDEHNNVNVEVPPIVKTGKKPRRNTLKELNSDLPASENIQQTTEPTKIPRLTRQTRKLVQAIIEEHTKLDSSHGDGTKEDEIQISGSKKSKKNKSKKEKSKENVSDDLERPVQEQETAPPMASKKKIPKLARQQSAEHVINTGMHSSIESYYSAVGSPPSTVQDTAVGSPPSTVQDTAVGSPPSTVQDTETEKDDDSYITACAKLNKTEKLNESFDKSEKQLNKTFDKSEKLDGNKTETKLDTTFDKTDTKLDTTFDKTDTKLDTTFDKTDTKLDTTFDKTDTKLNTTFDKTDTKLDTTFDKTDTKLETTFEKTVSEKSPLISSDRDSNETFDKSDVALISITSDEDSKTENIINTTPLLVESSIDESTNAIDTSMRKSTSFDKGNSNIAPTPLKRDGTFTRESPEPDELKTTPPTMSKISMSGAGSTPYHTRNSSRVSQKDRSALNVTRSIEKLRQNSTSELGPSMTRQTRVMFCSPTNNPVVESTIKRKIIKSSLKGSNKSFVFQDNERATSGTRPSALPARPSALPTRPSAPALPRKRSLTSSDADATRSKRSRHDTLPRATRTRAATALPLPQVKVSMSTPAKPAVTPRTALPDFAALHQRRFAKMESLGECQQRKAQRARQLLTPNRLTATNKAEKPKTTKVVKTPVPPSTSSATTITAPKTYALESLRPGFTRFGFKMNYDVNPFSVPSKTDTKAKDNKGHFSTGKIVNKTTEKENPKVKVAANNPKPSLTGATAMRKEQARQVVMRERRNISSIREQSRNEARVTIKGVRTNRRFDLQMQMRNLE